MDKPTHWCLSWALTLELGFEDEKYLPRKAGLLFYPEYFDENGEPKLDMLPIDTIELYEERKRKRKQAEREKKWWYKFYKFVRWQNDRKN
jgi:hypothetical protein